MERAFEPSWCWMWTCCGAGMMHSHCIRSLGSEGLSKARRVFFVILGLVFFLTGATHIFRGRRDTSWPHHEHLSSLWAPSLLCRRLFGCLPAIPPGITPASHPAARGAPCPLLLLLHGLGVGTRSPRTYSHPETQMKKCTVVLYHSLLLASDRGVAPLREIAPELGGLVQLKEVQKGHTPIPACSMKGVVVLPVMASEEGGDCLPAPQPSPQPWAPLLGDAVAGLRGFTFSV